MYPIVLRLLNPKIDPGKLLLDSILIPMASPTIINMRPPDRQPVSVSPNATTSLSQTLARGPVTYGES